MTIMFAKGIVWINLDFFFFSNAYLLVSYLPSDSSAYQYFMTVRNQPLMSVHTSLKLLYVTCSAYE